MLMILLVAFLGLLTIFPEGFADNIKRSCKANYFGWVTRLETSQTTLNIPLEAIGFELRDNEFSAQGGCGKLVPNRCRRRARNKVLACAKAHVNSPNQPPGECRENAITRYPIQNLTSAIKEKACGVLKTRDGVRISALLSRPYKVQVLLGVRVYGSDDCGFRKPGKTVVDGQRYPIKGNKLFLREPLKTFNITCQ